MLIGIFSSNEESQSHVNDGSKSPRTIAIDQLQIEISYVQTWSQMNQQHISNLQQIAELKQQHTNESFLLDQDASDVLWETSFLPKVKELEEAQILLEETRKKLESEKLKVYRSVNIIEIKGY
jgi:hypothetical protein